MRTETKLALEQTQKGASYEVSSDTKVFTMTMEILPKPTSNKLCGSLGNMISMKNEGTTQVHEGTARVLEGTARRLTVIRYLRTYCLLYQISAAWSILPFSMRCSMLTFAITLVMCLIEDEDFVKRLRSTYILVLV
ncbi:hypothetical protein Tco_0408870 [Tanacetum coccineum]